MYIILDDIKPSDTLSSTITSIMGQPVTFYDIPSPVGHPHDYDINQM